MTYLDLFEVYLQYRGEFLHGSVLIDTHKYLVEQCLEIVALNSVHYKPLQWAWLETPPVGARPVCDCVLCNTCSGGTTMVS